ncbi:MAG: M28 family peptidase [Planctomycetota bacterium]
MTKAAWLVLGALAACRANPSDAQILRWANEATLPENVPVAHAVTGHRGPAVAAGTSGPARFARLLLEEFDAPRALGVAAFVDGFYREPANEGYDAAFDRALDELRSAGFGTDPRFALEVIEETPKHPAWTPRRGEIVLSGASTAETLHRFDAPADRDRTLLPSGAPSADVEGPVVLEAARVVPGSVLVTRDPLRSLDLDRVRAAGAVAVLSASLASFNVDPSGKDRHLDAIQYVSLRGTSPLPVAQISPRSYERIAALARAGAARIALRAEVTFADRPLRTLIATIVGATRPDEAVVIPAHLQEPGACDNASGVAAMVEGARASARLLASGRLAAPARSLAFVFGDEHDQSRTWLERSNRRAVAAISCDMAGESREATGAILLLERAPDPALTRMLPPDERTAWAEGGASDAKASEGGLSIVARCAVADVAAFCDHWETGEHPYEGGSDHDVFLAHGVPAILLWHFTDFGYHTSLDRMEHVDAQEMARTGAAILSAAWALADPVPADLTRYLESLRIERGLRLSACAAAKDEALATQWRAHFDAARRWLRALCLNVSLPEKTP